MRTRGRWMVSMGLVVALMGAAAPASAQGWVELPVLRGGFSVEKVRSDVRVRVHGRVAVVEVTEWFVNDGNRVAEGDYLYPLPSEAVFEGFSLFQGDTELRGEIMDAGQARRIYEDIVRRRADPALIELAGHGLLRARVFPIEPGQERKVTLRYTQVLKRAGDALQLVYAGAVRGTMGRSGIHTPEGRSVPEPVEASFEIEVANGHDFLDPFSPTHDLEVSRHEEGLDVSVDDEVLGRLSIFFPFAGADVGLSLATHRPVGEDGYFMLTLSPERLRIEAAPKDVTVVLDVSGSMSGDKIVQARQALNQLLGSLSRDDRFRLIAFSNSVRMSGVDWSLATGHEVAEAREWVSRLVADGGTDIGSALEEAFRLESPEERLPIVVFLTDGLPSVGEQSPERLADRAEKVAGRARVFTFGVGHDVNTHLLDRLGEAGRGSTDYVQPGENVERVVGLPTAKIRHPVLTDIALSGGPTRLTDVFPVRIPDVFVGQELVLFGRYEGDGQSRVSVDGSRAGAALTFTTEVRFPEATEANGYIPRLWASRKLGHLERQIWTEGASESLIAEIRGVALRYGLPSKYTSYLVQEPDIVAATPGMPDMQRLMVTGAARTAVGTLNSPAQASGQRAVRDASAARKRREATTLDELRQMEEEYAGGETATVRAVAGRTFTLERGVWTDATHDDVLEVIEVKAFSTAYFEFVRALPELAPVFGELDRVIIAGQQMSISISDTGLDEIDNDRLTELVDAFRNGEAVR